MSIKYYVTAMTGSNTSDADIKIKFRGTLGISPDTADGGTLESYSLESKYNDFRHNGGVDTFEITVPKDIGEVVQIWLTGENSDFWSVQWVRVWPDGHQDKLHQFTIDHLLKGETISAWADGVSPYPDVEILGENQDVYLYTDFFVEQNGSGEATKTTVHRTNTFSSEVSENTSTGRSSERSWSIQAGYAPPDSTGGLSYSAGYSGSIAESIEKSTGMILGHAQTVEFTHEVPLAAHKHTAYKIAWHEIVTLGSASLFDGKFAFKQVTSMVGHFDIVGVYDTEADVPAKYQEGRRVETNR